MSQANQVTVSPDGRNAYSVSYGASSVSIFDRNPETGALRQKPGGAGCISTSGADGCRRGRGLEDARGVAVSPDGMTVYVASQDSAAVAIFDRDPETGALRQKAGRAVGISGRVAERRCAKSPSLRAAAGVTVSPDGKSVYVASLTYGAGLRGHGLDLRTRSGSSGR